MHSVVLLSTQRRFLWVSSILRTPVMLTELISLQFCKKIKHNNILIEIDMRTFALTVLLEVVL